jgi:20S proteasome subunit alpha 2
MPTLLSRMRGFATGPVALLALLGGAVGSERRYSFSLTTFGPSGTLTQLEYAMNAVEVGAVAVAVSHEGGVVMASPRIAKPMSSLVRSSGCAKVVPVAAGTGLCYAGLAADFRVLAARAQKVCSKYLSMYGEEEGVPAQALVNSLAQCMQEHTQMGGVRPFGVSLLLGSSDGKLWRIDPSGVASPWLACAIGKKASVAEKILEEGYRDGMSRKEASELALKAILACADDSFSEDDIDIASVQDF